MGVIWFRAQLQRRGPAAAVVLDETQVAAVGEGTRRFPVVATVNGYAWRTSVARMGGEFLVGLNREVRDGAGVQAGDEAEGDYRAGPGAAGGRSARGAGGGPGR